MKRVCRRGADELRQENIGQSNEPVAGKQLAANFDARSSQLVHPTHEGRMRNAQVARELLAGHRDHHVLHQGVEEFVEFPVHYSGVTRKWISTAGTEWVSAPTEM